MFDSTLPFSRYAIFFDFDNTVTAYDVFDDFVRRFAADDGWGKAEKQWREGRIGSRECLERQLASVRVTRRAAEKYLEGVHAEPAFAKIVDFLRSQGAEPVILSDSFYFIIDRILKNSGISGVRVFSNQARFHRDRVMPYFPDRGRGCAACANCKKRYLQFHTRQGRPVIFVGDGRSDFCASSLATVVFAKGELARYLKEKKVFFIPFRTLEDVYRHMSGVQSEEPADAAARGPEKP